MTHLTVTTVCSGDFKQCALFLFDFAPMPENCSWDADFLMPPERHPEARTVHIPAVIDLKMFDSEVNRTLFVDAVSVSTILE